LRFGGYTAHHLGNIVKHLHHVLASLESDAVLFNAVCAIRELKPDVGSIPAAIGAMNAPRLAGHGVFLGGKSGDAVHVAIMR
jgi:hypothetical protein